MSEIEQRTVNFFYVAGYDIACLSDRNHSFFNWNQTFSIKYSFYAYDLVFSPILDRRSYFIRSQNEGWLRARGVSFPPHFCLYFHCRISFLLFPIPKSALFFSTGEKTVSSTFFFFLPLAFPPKKPFYVNHYLYYFSVSNSKS